MAFESDLVNEVKACLANIIRELPDGFEFYGADLSGMLTEYVEENRRDGDSAFAPEAATATIFAHPAAARGTHDWLKELETSIDIFDAPGEFLVATYELVFSSVLAACPIIDGNWNDEVVLDEKIRSVLLSEIAAVDSKTIEY